MDRAGEIETPGKTATANKKKELRCLELSYYKVATGFLRCTKPFKRCLLTGLLKGVDV